MRARKRNQKLLDQTMLRKVRIMINQPSISLYGEKAMNQFKPQEDLYDPATISRQINKDFHKSNTSPLPTVPPAIHKVTHYPQSWDKAKKLPSPHQISETILSNRNYVIVCTVIMSAIFLIYALKLVFAVIVK